MPDAKSNHRLFGSVPRSPHPHRNGLDSGQSSSPILSFPGLASGKQPVPAYRPPAQSKRVVDGKRLMNHIWLVANAGDRLLATLIESGAVHIGQVKVGPWMGNTMFSVAAVSYPIVYLNNTVDGSE